MSQEKIDAVITERRALNYKNKYLKQISRYHKERFEEKIKEAEEHMLLSKKAEAEISENNKKFFDKGTQLEELTGTKRIEFLR